MGAWITDFFAQTDLNKYPVALRTEGGIGFQVGRDVVSNFVGHPVHYVESQEMKPITLDWIPLTGEFEGSWFGWDMIKKCPTYCGYELYTPKAIIWNGIAYPLNFLRFENRMIADIPIGTYEIIYNEWGMNEVVTIPEPVEGTLEFDAPEQEGWGDYLHINPRRIIGGEQRGNVFVLTRAMNYPIMIDPDYSGTTADGQILGESSGYSTARNTATSLQVTATTMLVGQAYGSSTYTVARAFLKIDTSGIPDTDTVSQVNLKMVVVNENSTQDFSIVIRKYDWSTRDPIAAGNMEANYDGCLAATSDDNIWRNTADGVVVNTQYSSGNLNTAWVSQTGYTYYGLLSSRDISSSAPVGSEAENFATQNHATTAYRPVLTVTHASSSRAGRMSLLGVG